MRLEKVNDNQIRCVLTREDLELRQIKISELAYGSDKTKMLFKDVMQQASYEFGFEAENIPLMIEAIPMSTGCVVFIITKVENPEELDTRFSRFAPSVIEGSEEEHEDYDDPDYDISDDISDIKEFYPYDDSDSDEDSFGMPEMFDDSTEPDNKADNKPEKNADSRTNKKSGKKNTNKKSDKTDDDKTENKKAEHEKNTPIHSANIEIIGADAIHELIDSLADEGNVFNLFKKIAASASASAPKTAGRKDDNDKYAAQRVYRFDNLEDVGKACRVLNSFYQGNSSLYKNTEDNNFYLLLERADFDKKDFIKAGNLMLEYSSYVKTNSSSLAYLKEHYKCLLENDAVEGMSQF